MVDQSMLFEKRFWFRTLLILVLLALLCYYFYLFFTPGMRLDGVFLKKYSNNMQTEYIGRNAGHDIRVSVKPVENQPDSVHVIFQMPGLERTYTVTFGQAMDERRVTVFYPEDSIAYQGVYDKKIPALFPGNVDDINIYTNSFNTWGVGYRISNLKVVRFADPEQNEIRGDAAKLILAIIILAITAIDFAFPLFFFSLKHCLTVKDPEPSDLYMTTQMLSWFILPIIALILMISALY